MQVEEFDAALGASYQLEERLGAGAMGEVWRALDRRRSEHVAAKLLLNEHISDPEIVGRFIRERAILLGLRHPNLVAIRDMVVEGDRLAIVMDLVDGGSLRDVLKQRGPFPPALAVAVTAAALDGLAAAHDKEVLHRDIKPDNVLLTKDWMDQAPGSVKVTDFGIARLLDGTQGPTTGLLGTPGYMSPELLVAGTCGLPADIYGVGIMLYELLAGRTPYSGRGTDYSIAHRHVACEPPELPVPDALWAVLETMLDKNPAERPTAADAASRLRRVLPELKNLPPLPPQAAPETFQTADQPGTLLRADLIAGPQQDEKSVGLEGPGVPIEERDLGEASHETLFRPVQRPKRPEGPEPAPATRRTDTHTPWWRNTRILGATAASLLLLGGAIAWVTLSGDDKQDEQQTATVSDEPIVADQEDQPLPSGLTIQRQAEYDAKAKAVALTLTYTAQAAPLSGPFLEAIPDLGDGCVVGVEFQGASGQPNLPTTTGIDDDCAWSITPATIDAQGSQQVTATVPLDLSETEDPAAALDAWLEAVAARTTEDTLDTTITSTSYPAQRMTGVEVKVPDRVLSNRTLHVTILPVWPNGVDSLNPLYDSNSIGEPSTLITSIAGGSDGVKLSDGCGGALVVQRGGLAVTARDTAAACTLNAEVGNFQSLQSNEFAIVTRNS